MTTVIAGGYNRVGGDYLTNGQFIDLLNYALQTNDMELFKAYLNDFIPKENQSYYFNLVDKFNRAWFNKYDKAKALSMKLEKVLN